MEEYAVDQIQLAFDPSALFILNIVLAMIMFGVALDLRLDDFRRIIKEPRAPLIGLFTQFILLPALTFLLTLIINPAPSIVLGMILVASCPGGNMSNIFTHFARGNTALSVSMTGVSTAASVFMTPLNIAFWGGLHPTAASLLREININPFEMLLVVFLVLGLPLILGMLVSARFPSLAIYLRKPFRFVSIGFFLAFIVMAFLANWQNFLDYIGFVVFAVFVQNAIALFSGYGLARLSGLGKYDSRATSIEVGIQNSGLGLILIFDFFGGLGGMALVAAWWGIWHIIAGLTVAGVWSRFPVEVTPAADRT